jgi:hypothetical protein
MYNESSRASSADYDFRPDFSEVARPGLVEFLKDPATTRTPPLTGSMIAGAKVKPTSAAYGAI